MAEDTQPQVRRAEQSGRQGDRQGDRPANAPEEPTDLGRSDWLAAFRRTLKEFRIDNLTDWAAALTYYGLLSIFPGLLVLVSLIGLAGDNTVKKLTDNLSQAAPGSVRDIITKSVDSLQKSHNGTAGALAIFGLATALWSASGYISAFMRASNAIYDVPEGRPIWKTLPIRIGVTVVMMVLLVITALGVVLTGGLAERVGKMLGVGHAAVTVWGFAKWPILLLIVSIMFALLYWASPNAKQGFRWVSPGGLLAVLVWVIASGLFAFYVANFGSYNKTYGSLAGVIIFLVWLWLSNVAVLLGAELNAELERGRAIAAGHPSDAEPYIELRDSSKIKERDAL
jgi:membrane protein